MLRYDIHDLLKLPKIFSNRLLGSLAVLARRLVKLGCGPVALVRYAWLRAPNHAMVRICEAARELDEALTPMSIELGLRTHAVADQIGERRRALGAALFMHEQLSV